MALALIQLGTSWASPPSFTRLTYSVMIVVNDPSDMRPLGPGLTDMNGAKMIRSIGITRVMIYKQQLISNIV